MTPAVFLAIVAAQVCTIGGQVLFKVAMHRGDHRSNRSRFAVLLTAGIAMMTVNFFLWLGLLARLDLSYLYPFDGISRVLLVFAASVVLKERLTLRAWLGVLVIACGIVVVSMT